MACVPHFTQHLCQRGVIFVAPLALIRNFFRADNNFFATFCTALYKHILPMSTQEVVFRLPLFMAVSWSYVRHLVHLFLRFNCFPFALIWSFSFLHLFLFTSFLTSFFLIILWSNSDRPRWTQLLCFPFWQSNFIKLYNGGLQYKFIRTFCIKYKSRFHDWW